jgi:hypothetical protein
LVQQQLGSTKGEKEEMKVIYVASKGNALANKALDVLDSIIHDCFTHECDTRILNSGHALELLRHNEPDAVFVAVYTETEEAPAWSTQMGYRLVLTEEQCSDTAKLREWLYERHCQFSGYTPPKLQAGTNCYSTKKAPYFVSDCGQNVSTIA